MRDLVQRKFVLAQQTEIVRLGQKASIPVKTIKREIKVPEEGEVIITEKKKKPLSEW